MYAKILVPLDGSKRAEMIRAHVRELAGRFQATVILIMVIEYIYSDGIGEPYTIVSERNYRAKLKESEAYLNKVASNLQSNGIACKTIVAHGTVVEKIIEAANAEDVDLIAERHCAKSGATLPAGVGGELRPVHAVLA